jgi:hypothetical protein
MARLTVERELHVLVLSRQEAVNLVGLLTAQLGDRPLVGNQSGAAPTVNVMDRGMVVQRLVVTLDRE